MITEMITATVTEVVNGSATPNVVSFRCPARRRSLLLGGGGGRESRPVALLLLVLAGDRVLELAHALTQAAPDLRNPLRPEDQEQDDDEDHDFPGAKPPHRPPSVAANDVRG